MWSRDVIKNKIKLGKTTMSLLGHRLKIPKEPITLSENFYLEISFIIGEVLFSCLATRRNSTLFCLRKSGKFIIDIQMYLEEPRGIHKWIPLVPSLLGYPCHPNQHAPFASSAFLSFHILFGMTWVIISHNVSVFLWIYFISNRHLAKIKFIC